ncbi:uncharacterized protein TNCV_2285911 [Trichonephila clavipes]|nr:uncharacterized protein TNCV_2285911 [Trichonephila clavipes]
MPKSSQMHKEEKSFVKEEKKKEKLAASPMEKVTKKQKNSANSSSATTKSLSDYSRRYNGNAIETLLMTSQINTDFVNHLVALTTEPSTSLVHVGADACESKINSLLRYKDYDSQKNSHKDFQKQFVDNPSIINEFGVRFGIDYGLEMI